MIELEGLEYLHSLELVNVIRWRLELPALQTFSLEANLDSLLKESDFGAPGHMDKEPPLNTSRRLANATSLGPILYVQVIQYLLP